MGPICSWSHSENIALCFAGTESGPFAWMWRGNDERQAKNGTLSLRVSSHPTSFPLSSFFSCTITHISFQLNLSHFAGEMKELGKNAQSNRFLPSPKTVLPVTEKHQNFFLLVIYKNDIKISNKLYRSLLSWLIGAIFKKSQYFNHHIYTYARDYCS